MIRFRFIDPITEVVYSDARPTNASVKYSLSQTSDWSASFPKNLTALKDVTEGMIVEIYYRSDLLLTGLVQSKSEKWNGQRVDLALTGRGVVDKLFDYRGYSFGYYENVERLSILAQLLDRAGWRVGDVRSWKDYEVPTTVDLRNEKRLLSQVSTFVAGFPSTYFRYGGVRAGYHTLDVGTFDFYTDTQLLRATDIPDLGSIMPDVGVIDSITRTTQLTEILNSVEVWGGDVQDNLGVERTISLKDTLAGYPALATDPDFPIITDVAGALYRIKNNAIGDTVGGQSTERYTQYAPEKTNANATTTAIQTAALALYNRGVAFLKDHEENVDKISVKAHGEFPFVSIGDRVYVNATARQSIIDPFADEIVEVMESEINGDFRCTNLTINFSNNAVDWSYELTNGNAVDLEDIFVSVYDSASNKNQVTGTAVIAGYNPPKWSYYYMTLAGGYPDTTLADGTPAKLFSIPVPITGLPVWTPTRMYSSCVPIANGSPDPYEIEIVSDFVYPSTPMVIKAAIENTGWTDSSSFTFNYYIVWSQ